MWGNRPWLSQALPLLEVALSRSLPPLYRVAQTESEPPVFPDFFRGNCRFYAAVFDIEIGDQSPKISWQECKIMQLAGLGPQFFAKSSGLTSLFVRMFWSLYEGSRIQWTSSSTAIGYTSCAGVTITSIDCSGN
jgi:hypothetical protein